VVQAADLVFRQARGEDADTIARLHANSWRAHYRGAYTDGYLDGDVFADRQGVWRQRLEAPVVEAATLLAEEGGEPLGFVHVVFDDDPMWGSLVDNLHVIPPRQRGGIGTALLGVAASAVAGRGQGGVYLWVLEQNTAAQAFYRARGGECVGRDRVPPPGGIPGRLNGTPTAFRYAWPDPGVLLA
jgi:GNAT superfamily N-acetyltransferase